MQAKVSIIVALNVSTRAIALKLVDLLAPHVGAFKVGFELIHAAGGPSFINAIHKRGGRVFYDCKLHDIPNTMGKAAAAIAHQNVWMFNCHASAGLRGMRAVVENSGASLAIAVTVLTSMSDEDCQMVYGVESAADQVAFFARSALEMGCNGVVCSPPKSWKRSRATRSCDS